jgi:hypothetical protein
MRTTEKLRQGWLWPARERRADPRRPALPQSHGRAAPAWEGASHTGLTYGYAPYIVPLARDPRQVRHACAAPAPWRICQSQRLSASRALHSAFSGRTKRARARRLPPAESRALLRTAAAVLRSALPGAAPPGGGAGGAAARVPRPGPPRGAVSEVLQRDVQRALALLARHSRVTAGCRDGVSHGGGRASMRLCPSQCCGAASSPRRTHGSRPPRVQLVISTSTSCER